jgi:lipopolysaccharide transport system ATP-binding protein
MTKAIRVEHLSKRYRIGAAQAKFRYGMMRDVLVDVAMTPVRLVRGLTGKGMRGTDATSYIWALDDVSFDLEEGRVLGIVGRNGAGKSTLLKVLSRVTEPTKGLVVVRGRVGSR